MSLKDIFNFQKNDAPTEYRLGLAFPFPYGDKKTKFAEIFVFELLRKILTDCYRHAADFPQDKKEALWDSAVSSQARRGLITLLARAMTDKAKVYLVYDSGIVRKATEEEKKEIDLNPAQKGRACLDFTDYHRSTILLNLAYLVEQLLYNANASLNLSKSVLVKIATLRESVSNLNAQDIIQQAKDIKDGLQKGEGALLDAGDAVELPAFDTNPMEAALDVLYGLISMVSGMPRVYVSGEGTEGLNASGEGDETSVERGLEYYFNSVFVPACEQLLGVRPVFKTSSWRKFAQVANFLPVIEASDLISQDVKTKLMKELFG